MNSPKRLAIVGTGISGLGCAYKLRHQKNLSITLFEKENRLGGHSNTIDYSPPNSSKPAYGIDTGFLVFNKWTYPRLVKLFEELDVPVANSDMSFSVSIPLASKSENLEWAGTNLSTVFAQRKNLLNPQFWGMLSDIIKFNRLGKALAKSTKNDSLHPSKLQTVEEFLDANQLGLAFRNWYLLPMIGAIWSCPASEMMKFPIQTLMHFCKNHGLLNILHRPQWLTVKGGSREYVQRIAEQLNNAGVVIQKDGVKEARRLEDQTIELMTESGKRYVVDELVFACHSDDILGILKNPSEDEIDILKSIPYQKNTAYVHADATLLPKNSKVWAAWNYSTSSLKSGQIDASSRVCVHYLINQLQPLPDDLSKAPVVVSLNPHQLPKTELTHSVIHYSHPLFDAGAIAAQHRLPMIQGVANIWYCGAWTGYGFHEDGLRSGELVAEDIIERLTAPVASTEMAK